MPPKTRLHANNFAVRSPREERVVERCIEHINQAFHGQKEREVLWLELVNAIWQIKLLLYLFSLEDFLLAYLEEFEQLFTLNFSLTLGLSIFACLSFFCLNFLRLQLISLGFFLDFLLLPSLLNDQKMGCKLLLETGIVLLDLVCQNR